MKINVDCGSNLISSQAYSIICRIRFYLLQVFQKEGSFEYINKDVRLEVVLGDA